MSEDRGRQSDDFDTLSLGSHQMRSPLVAARSLLNTVLAGYAGPLNERQLDMLQRVDQRCLQAEKAIHRLLTVARLRREKVETTTALITLAFLVDQLSTQHAGQAHDRSIEMIVDSNVTEGHVRGTEALFGEVLQTLLENAFKYTPDHGSIRLSLRADQKELTLTVADSGIGISAHMREQVFAPFVRGGQAKDSSISGTGLGLTLVKAIVEASGGRVSARSADLGGAEIVVQMPLVQQEAFEHMKDHSKEHPMRVVIVGGVAAGPKVASKVIRLCPEAEVTVVERGKFLSYAGCGLPY